MKLVNNNLFRNCSYDSDSESLVFRTYGKVFYMFLESFLYNLYNVAGYIDLLKDATVIV